jgi:hypothetical protein
MEAFYEKGNWFDGVHPTKKGAVLFSRWLAERFLEPEFSKINHRGKNQKNLKACKEERLKVLANGEMSGSERFKEHRE